MKLPYFVALCLLLPGCASSNIKDVLANLDKDCVRHYQGAVGGVAQGMLQFTIDCQPSGTPPTVKQP